MLADVGAHHFAPRSTGLVCYATKSGDAWSRKGLVKRFGETDPMRRTSTGPFSRRCNTRRLFSFTAPDTSGDSSLTMIFSNESASFSDHAGMLKMRITL
jgi:hypothetical protein